MASHCAEKALGTVQSQAKANRLKFTSIGAFNGWGGILYLFTHLAAVWNRQGLFASADRIAARISELVQQDESLDVIGGAAGCIGSLLSLYHCLPSDHLLEVAIQCGDHLISQAQTTQKGVGWLTHLTAPHPITGFAHGSAGIIWALLALAEVTNESRFRSVASSALPYERQAFSSESKNWPSLRPSEGDRTIDDPVAWCYGAAGIRLALSTPIQWVYSSKQKLKQHCILHSPEDLVKITPYVTVIWATLSSSCK
jgi:lantibiotic modifying enzyme